MTGFKILKIFRKVIALLGIWFVEIISADSTKVLEIFPNVITLGELSNQTGIYFNRIDFDIAKMKDSIKLRDLKKEASEKYSSIMKYKPDTSDPMILTEFQIDRQNEYSKLPKDKVIDSILIPDAIHDGVKSILFSAFANKPYFDNIFKNEICSFDSVSKTNWNEMKVKLGVFNDSVMINNFKKITFNDSAKTYYHPIGLLLIKENDQYIWYLPFGWEYKYVTEVVAKKYKKTTNTNCIMLGHILGYFFNFNFSKLLYTIRCG